MATGHQWAWTLLAETGDNLLLMEERVSELPERLQSDSAPGKILNAGTVSERLLLVILVLDLEFQTEVRLEDNHEVCLLISAKHSKYSMVVFLS